MIKRCHSIEEVEEDGPALVGDVLGAEEGQLLLGEEAEVRGAGVAWPSRRGLLCFFFLLFVVVSLVLVPFSNGCVHVFVASEQVFECHDVHTRRVSRDGGVVASKLDGVVRASEASQSQDGAEKNGRLLLHRQERRRHE